MFPELLLQVSTYEERFRLVPVNLCRSGILLYLVSLKQKPLVDRVGGINMSPSRTVSSASSHHPFPELGSEELWVGLKDGM